MSEQHDDWLDWFPPKVRVNLTMYGEFVIILEMPTKAGEPFRVERVWDNDRMDEFPRLLEELMADYAKLVAKELHAIDQEPPDRFERITEGAAYVVVKDVPVKKAEPVKESEVTGFDAEPRCANGKPHEWRSHPVVGQVCKECGAWRP